MKWSAQLYVGFRFDMKRCGLMLRKKYRFKDYRIYI